MSRNPCFLLPFSFCGPPTGEESAPDGAEQAAPPGVVHINAAAAWRGEEAAFRDLSCKTRISRSCWAFLLLVASHTAIDLMKMEHWPAKQVKCLEILVFFCHSHFVVLPLVKNQHLTAPNKRRRLVWCTSMLQRLGEAKRPHLATSLARHVFLAVVGLFFSQLHLTLLSIFNLRSLSFSFTHYHHSFPCFGEEFSVTFLFLLVCVSVLLVGMSPRESFHYVECELFHR